MTASTPEAPSNVVLLGRSRRALDRLNHFRFDIDLRNADETTRKIAAAYGRAWRVTSGEADAMSRYAAEVMHSGLGLSPRDIAKIDRVDRALHALERKIRDLNEFAGVTVTGGANKTAEAVVDATLNSLARITGLDRRFTTPSANAIETLVLRSTERIESATMALTARQSGMLKDALLRGLVLGENPRETARQVMDKTEQAFFGGLSRANTIARTEITDAHRGATRIAYNSSDLVVGWKWLASLSARTCPACWAMHGTFHEKTEIQYGHQNCRCTQIPVLADDMPSDHDLGSSEEIFFNLPREDQLAIMGPGRLKALEAGAPWSMLTFLKHNSGWRPSQVVSSVGVMEHAAGLAVATTPGDIIDVPGFDNADLMRAAFEQGGLTVQTMSGDIPSTGIAVARQGTSAVIDAREFFGPGGPVIVADWLTTYGDRLDTPGAHMGMWYDTANGKVVLDVVEIVHDRAEAIALGRAEDQIAVFDLGTFEEIPTGGTGGYANPDDTPLGPIDTPLKTLPGDVGKTVQFRDGDFTGTGKILKVNEWGSTVILTDDGREQVLWPDQILSVSREGESVKARVEELARLAEASMADYGLDKADYTGASPDVAHGIHETYGENEADWPGIDTQELLVGPNTQAFAVTSTGFNRFGTEVTDSSITFEENYADGAERLQKAMQGAEDTGHFHGGTADDPVDYVIDHEFGHVLQMDLTGDFRFNPVARARYFDFVADAYNALIDARKIPEPPPGRTYDEIRFETATEGGNEAGRRLAETWNSRVMDEYLRKDLSGYGASDIGEMVAEAYAIFRDHGPGKSVVADAITARLARMYHEKYGQWPLQSGLDEIVPEMDPTPVGSDGSEQIEMF